MSEEDYKKVETELQRQLHSDRFQPHHMDTLTATDLHDIMTHSIGNLSLRNCQLFSDKGVT